MTATYDKHELDFIYPENWTLTERDGTNGFVEVSLESPEGSIWSVSLFPATADKDQLLESVATALREQYEDFESFEFDGEIYGYASIGFDAHFYCLDFLVTAQARVFQHRGKTLHIFCQAENREFDRHQDVFNAITLSLLKASR